MEHDQYWSDRSWCSWLEFVFACWTEELPTGSTRGSLTSLVLLVWFGLVRSEIRQSLNPKDRERESHPCVNLHRKKSPQLLWNCVKQKSVSCTSNLLEQMYDFQRCIMFLQKWILNLQDLLRSQSLETVPIYIVLQYYPHCNTVCIHMYYECKKSNNIIVCHRLWSIL